MKKYLSIVVALMVTLFSFSSFAFDPPAKPSNGWYVLDQSGKLTTEQVSQLNHKIENLNKNTKNEYAIVVLSSLDGEDIGQAAQDTFRAWGVGKKDLNNGVMIIISTGERKTRIQTGKGAEGDLPDLRCNDILNNTLKPLLKKGQFYQGLDATLDAVSGHMETRSAEKTTAVTPDGGSVTKTNSVPASTPANPGCSVGPQNQASMGGVGLLLLVGLGGFLLFRFLSKKRQEQFERRSSYDATPSISSWDSGSSSSSYDSGSSSSYDSGSSFGGGDSGGGGSSGDW